ncbi:hypothetical protein I4F81_012264 [Pyropia yezoensis]|uniref:Uncharacterized protein n=1 Tax=Pyropia yezoensis TaxID=2788 RepID=A0ACC3CI71_PYRYE|nr:hypothetical protein I4F81_012264 [Neopyropia yezoensis]
MAPAPTPSSRPRPSATASGTIGGATKTGPLPAGAPTRAAVATAASPAPASAGTVAATPVGVGGAGATMPSTGSAAADAAAAVTASATSAGAPPAQAAASAAAAAAATAPAADETAEEDADGGPYSLAALSASLPGLDEAPPVVKAHRRYKIAMFSWESLHAIAVGGVAPHLTELAAGLERRGHEVHVYVRTGANQQPYEVIDGVHVHRVAFELSADFVEECANMCNAMVHFMNETESFMNDRFDICHAHDWLAAQALINIKRNMNRKCVFTVHSTEFGRCGNNSYGGQSARIRQIELEAIQLADRAVGVSGVLCDEIKAQYIGFDWAKLRCVYNGINCLRYDGKLWDPAAVRSLYNIGPMDPMVLFVGRMATQKGPDILVEAIPAVLAARPDAKFVLVGDGYMKAGLVDRAAELGISGAVFFTGSLSGQPLVDLFKATDVVAIPSRNEPFGIVTLEAWASNKPVVVTTSGGPREFVWHDHDGFLVDTNPAGMAWGITNCFVNFAHAQYMGERGRVKAAYQFSWDKIAADTNLIYDELLGAPPPPPPPVAEVSAEHAAAAAKEAQAVDSIGSVSRAETVDELAHAPPSSGGGGDAALPARPLDTAA